MKQGEGNKVDPAQWLADYDETLARAAANARTASANLEQVGGSATSPRGEVAVRVGPSGALEDLTLASAARSLEVDQLAQLILATARQAQRAVGEQVVAIMTDYVGDGPALDFVKQHLPPAAGGAGRSPADDRDDNDYFSNPPEIIR
ncbi:YbaB/EbfC family nucleoid-associated protein [Amycolatopsis anabasis]|uniref:YbaB/EbfC family nucleoid-associated protein n=1 Tax=Amycolatopsis anabasis TaxID=1840409 RepID=UPI001FE9382D|nr:YbaB/EbfC family nucleoid-associated protein [Amycolatopsis anabasis]